MAEGNRVTPKKAWEDKFLDTLRKTGNVSAACRAAKISRKTAYTEREENAELAAGWAEALEDAADDLEAEARRRAYNGTLKPVFHQGQKIATVREYSDTLMIFLLKATKPEKFRERSEVNVNVRDVDAAIERELERLATAGQAAVPGEVAGDEEF